MTSRAAAIEAIALLDLGRRGWFGARWFAGRIIARTLPWRPFERCDPGYHKYLAVRGYTARCAICGKTTRFKPSEK